MGKFTQAARTLRSWLKPSPNAISPEQRHQHVGPGKLWKSKREFQIRFLRGVGLEPRHTLLDLGCGTLRGGIPLIEYLETGHYGGFEVRPDVLEEGRKELRESGLEGKNPTLSSAPSLKAAGFNCEFDFVWAFSVLIHMEDRILTDTLAAVRGLLKEDGGFYGNVNLGDRADGQWAGFPVVFRSWSFYEDACFANGLKVTDLGSLAEFGHEHPGKSEAHQAAQRMLKIERA